MYQEGQINQQSSKHQILLDAMNESIEQLQEAAFLLNEQKQQGVKEISIEDYEQLLNWSLETLRICRDQYE